MPRLERAPAGANRREVGEIPDFLHVSVVSLSYADTPDRSFEIDDLAFRIYPAEALAVSRLRDDVAHPLRTTRKRRDTWANRQPD